MAAERVVRGGQAKMEAARKKHAPKELSVALAFRRSDRSTCGWNSGCCGSLPGLARGWRLARLSNGGATARARYPTSLADAAKI